MLRFVFALLVAALLAGPLSAADESAKPIRAGIIGLDTSHVIAFTKAFNSPDKQGDAADVTIVAAYPGGSPDVEASYSRVEMFTRQVREMGVEIVDSIDKLLEKVDVVLLESVDGRPHLAQATPVILAGKPLFIDKPVAGSLADAIAIFALAKEHKVPCFSSSSLRFGPELQGIGKNEKVGEIVGCSVHAPCSLEEHHPDLFWYGVHGVEMLYTVMSTGCEEVSRAHTADTDFVTGRWKDGRIGTYRGIRRGDSTYGAIVYGTKGIVESGRYAGYVPLVEEIAKFFKTGKSPVPAEETIEMFTFMEAADESKRQGGAPVKLADVLQKAQAEAAKKK
ncbi:MAG: Gfo/Idh/MocA family oxidoreductase [Pirellulales bacterium]|nr:Gfo/Idh/MocA family oxidoreductase [Pirellulales bacterium]